MSNLFQQAKAAVVDPKRTPPASSGHTAASNVRVTFQDSPLPGDVAAALLAVAAHVEQQDRRMREALARAAEQGNGELLRQLIDAWDS